MGAGLQASVHARESRFARPPRAPPRPAYPPPMPPPSTLVTALLAAAVALALLAAVGLAALTARLGHRVESGTAPTGAFVEVGGHRLHYLDAGPRDAPAIVLLHGASAHLRDLEATLGPPLAARFRTLAFDRPGSGWSEPVVDAAGDPARQAALVADALAALGVERALWVGHSWGGSVALAALVERPDAVAGAALLAAPTAAVDGPSLPWPIRLAALPMIGEAFGRTLVAPLGLRALPDLLRDSFRPEPPPEPIDGYSATIDAPLSIVPDRFVATARDLVGLSPALERLSGRLDAIEGTRRPPLLLVYGERDPVMAPERHAHPLAERFPGTELVVLPGAGHLIHHTRTDEVVDAIARFAERVWR